MEKVLTPPSSEERELVKKKMTYLGKSWYESRTMVGCR